MNHLVSGRRWKAAALPNNIEITWVKPSIVKRVNGWMAKVVRTSLEGMGELARAGRVAGESRVFSMKHVCGS